MNRLAGSGYVDAIECARAALTPRLRKRLQHVDFLCGADPIFAGFGDDVQSGAAWNGRSRRDTAHCAFAFGQSFWPRDRRATTVVVPTLRHATPWTFVHELGHALDEATDFTLRANPVTSYARTTRTEAFAEAFCTWVSWWYSGTPLAAIDPKAAAFFDALA